MNWIGKLLGAFFGYLAYGIIGAVIGLFIGHWFDKGLAHARCGGADRQRIHDVFFRASFSVMGHVCKADGRVSQAEIQAAESVMARMRLSEEQRRRAIEAFQAGKAPEFDLDATLDEFIGVCRRRFDLLRMFLEIQLQGAMADGQIDAAEREILLRIARRLGISEADFQRLEALLTGGYRRTHARETGADELGEAYRELGVDPKADDAEVKRAYRKLMSEHHPDKLVARGLPEEMIEVAK
ncbi:MAG TPA: co-chaperone DjlA, partial [Gammaproteobacteria bacterium]|nr:co-chaperone DjlA [Gammaproteobacteria bacterium]